MEYIKIKDGRIEGHYSAAKIPEGKEYIAVKKFNGKVGDPISFYDKEMIHKPVDVLASEGLIEDNRGTYYDTKREKPEFRILEYGVSIPEGYTDKKPGDFDKWDGDVWIEDSEKKELHEKEMKKLEALQYLYDTDYKVVKAMEAGMSLNELYAGEKEKREAAREVIRNNS